MMHFTTDAFHISKNRKYNHMQSCVMHKNNIKFSFEVFSDHKSDQMLKFAC